MKRLLSKTSHNDDVHDEQHNKRQKFEKNCLEDIINATTEKSDGYMTRTRFNKLPIQQLKNKFNGNIETINKSVKKVKGKRNRQKNKTFKVRSSTKKLQQGFVFTQDICSKHQNKKNSITRHKKCIPSLFDSDFESEINKREIHISAKSEVEKKQSNIPKTEFTDSTFNKNPFKTYFNKKSCLLDHNSTITNTKLDKLEKQNGEITTYATEPLLKQLLTNKFQTENTILQGVSKNNLSNILDVPQKKTLIESNIDLKNNTFHRSSIDQFGSEKSISTPKETSVINNLKTNDLNKNESDVLQKNESYTFHTPKENLLMDCYSTKQNNLTESSIISQLDSEKSNDESKGKPETNSLTMLKQMNTSCMINDTTVGNTQCNEKLLSSGCNDSLFSEDTNTNELVQSELSSVENNFLSIFDVPNEKFNLNGNLPFVYEAKTDISKIPDVINDSLEIKINYNNTLSENSNDSDKLVESEKLPLETTDGECKMYQSIGHINENINGNFNLYSDSKMSPKMSKKMYEPNNVQIPKFENNISDKLIQNHAFHKQNKTKDEKSNCFVLHNSTSSNLTTNQSLSTVFKKARKRKSVTCVGEMINRNLTENDYLKFDDKNSPKKSKSLQHDSKCLCKMFFHFNKETNKILTSKIKHFAFNTKAKKVRQKLLDQKNLEATLLKMLIDNDAKYIVKSANHVPIFKPVIINPKHKNCIDLKRNDHIEPNILNILKDVYVGVDTLSGWDHEEYDIEPPTQENMRINTNLNVASMIKEHTNSPYLIKSVSQKNVSCSFHTPKENVLMECYSSKQNNLTESSINHFNSEKYNGDSIDQLKYNNLTIYKFNNRTSVKQMNTGIIDDNTVDDTKCIKKLISSNFNDSLFNQDSNINEIVQPKQSNIENNFPSIFDEKSNVYGNSCFVNKVETGISKAPEVVNNLQLETNYNSSSSENSFHTPKENVLMECYSSKQNNLTESSINHFNSEKSNGDSIDQLKSNNLTIYKFNNRTSVKQMNSGIIDDNTVDDTQCIKKLFSSNFNDSLINQDSNINEIVQPKQSNIKNNFPSNFDVPNEKSNVYGNSCFVNKVETGISKDPKVVNNLQLETNYNSSSSENSKDLHELFNSEKLPLKTTGKIETNCEFPQFLKDETEQENSKLSTLFKLSTKSLFDISNYAIKNSYDSSSDDDCYRLHIYDEENVDCAVNNSSTVANLLFDNSINPTIPNGLSLDSKANIELNKNSKLLISKNIKSPVAVSTNQQHKDFIEKSTCFEIDNLDVQKDFESHKPNLNFNLKNEIKLKEDNDDNITELKLSLADIKNDSKNISALPGKIETNCEFPQFLKDETVQEVLKPDLLVKETKLCTYQQNNLCESNKEQKITSENYLFIDFEECNNNYKKKTFNKDIHYDENEHLTKHINNILTEMYVNRMMVSLCTHMVNFSNDNELKTEDVHFQIDNNNINKISEKIVCDAQTENGLRQSVPTNGKTIFKEAILKCYKNNTSCETIIETKNDHSQYKSEKIKQSCSIPTDETAFQREIMNSKLIKINANAEKNHPQNNECIKSNTKVRNHLREIINSDKTINEILESKNFRDLRMFSEEEIANSIGVFLFEQTIDSPTIIGLSAYKEVYDHLNKEEKNKLLGSTELRIICPKLIKLTSITLALKKMLRSNVLIDLILNVIRKSILNKKMNSDHSIDHQLIKFSTYFVDICVRLRLLKTLQVFMFDSMVLIPNKYCCVLFISLLLWKNCLPVSINNEQDPVIIMALTYLIAKKKYYSKKTIGGCDIFQQELINLLSVYFNFSFILDTPSNLIRHVHKPDFFVSVAMILKCAHPTDLAEFIDQGLFPIIEDYLSTQHSDTNAIKIMELISMLIKPFRMTCQTTVATFLNKCKTSIDGIKKNKQEQYYNIKYNSYKIMQNKFISYLNDNQIRSQRFEELLVSIIMVLGSVEYLTSCVALLKWKPKFEQSTTLSQKFSMFKSILGHAVWDKLSVMDDSTKVESFINIHILGKNEFNTLERIYALQWDL